LWWSVASILCVPKTELSLYYTLSPTRALLLSNAGRDLIVTNDSFNERWVVELNRKIVEKSHSQVFARDAGVLDALAKLKTI
jgi:hypothetical protein